MHRRRSVVLAVKALSLLGLAALGGCVQDIKQDRTKLALMNAGVPDPTATCMAHRMAQKLSIAQLHHLQALGGPKQSWTDYLNAVRRVNDPDALEVLASSYGMCVSGLAY